jgi:endonuclease/exonuclease/phosphatase family metal-dependent hydrolase
MACVPLLAGAAAAVLFPQGARAQSASLRVAAYNIKHGRGMDDAVDLERIADVLRGLDADVITLQEVDDRTERTGRVDQVAVLSRLLGYEGVHGPHRPYQGGYYGNAVLTRLPVIAQRTRAIPPASGSALAVHETVVEAAPGVRISVVSVHLAGTPEERMAQAESVTASLADADHPVVLAGDFNGRPDDAVVLRLAADWTMAPKSGDPRTYPSPEPDREIDFVMWRDGGSGSSRRSLVLVDHRVVEEPAASDHRPIVADFEIHPLGERGR